MKIDKKQQFEILKRNINLGGLLADEIDMVLEPALQELVSDSAMPFDDILMAAIYPTLEAKLKELIEKHVNSLFDFHEEA